MKEVSFILSGRDDGYTGDFIDRFYIALKKNLEILSRYNLDYEIIVVDYNPFKNKRLIDNEKLKELLNHSNVKNVIVDKSILIADGLPENGFYEYFAKNVAGRMALGKLLFMTNADIIISEDIVKKLKDLSSNYSDNKFYRVRYRYELQDGKTIGEPLDLYSPNDKDSEICGGYSGDATIFSKKTFIEVAKGYDETSENHRTPKGQASMDGEILWQLVKNGVKMELIDLPYFHVTHPRQPKDGGYCRDGYKNRENWGCWMEEYQIINDNTIIIYK